MVRSNEFRKTIRRGFTLAEVLVTLAIIAVMAAVLLPALNNQISKGDVGRLASDLTNIQTAAQAYVSDVHRYPATLTQLMSSAGSNDINGATIPSALTAKWKGPYVSRDIVASTGAGGTLVDAFTITTSGTIKYLTVSVTNIAASDWANIEGTLDEGTSTAASTTSGVIRLSGTTTLTFLALPIQ